MSSATDRHRARVEALTGSPMDGEDIAGETSDQVRTIAPAAAGIIAELAANKLKSDEDADKKKKLEAGDAFQAQKAATDANKVAAMAEAEASGEPDPAGPKHRAAAAARTNATVAQAKAAYYQQQSPAAGAGMVPYGPPGGFPPPQKSIFTPTNVAIGVGAVGVLGLIVYLARRK